MEDIRNIPVKHLYGVGNVKAAAYEKMGVKTLYDLVYCFPRAYENRGNTVPLTAARNDMKNAVIMTVSTEPVVKRIRAGMDILKFSAFDDSGSCVITFFNQNYIKDKFKIGSVFRFWGKVDKVGRKYAMSSPDFDEWNENTPPSSMRPVYRLSDGLSQKQIRHDISLILGNACEQLKDTLPENIRAEMGLCTLSYAIRNIHEPEDYESLAIAKRRLIFDEFFLFSLGIATAQKKVREKGAFPCKSNDLSELLGCLPYKLTGAQMRTIDELKKDMASSSPMRRIIVGDVGCGKTICAAAALYIAVRSGRQGALMVPTEILARQHYADLSPLFEKLGIKTALLVGATPQREKKKIRQALSSADENERIDVIIGTHALLSDSVQFYAPGVIVTDEQHRFGVGQRALLAEKNKYAHVLVMSATPIPRSMALCMYGDLDISRIDEMPPGRQRVDTYAVDESYRYRLDNFIRKICADGGQVYIVCPSIEDNDDKDGQADISMSDISLISGKKEEKPPLKAAVRYAEELSQRLNGIDIGLIHGKLKSAEKDKIMQDFENGSYSVLVSTTVIEVGVNIPNACLMIIENAERFGLSQLHQLRGRVGRGKKKSYCVLVSDSKSESANRRLETMKTTYDGYRIAETDLQMRGPGDFLGSSAEGEVRQSGGVKFRLAGQCDDITLMEKAMAAARNLIDEDKNLEKHPYLAEAVANMFSPDSVDIS